MRYVLRNQFSQFNYLKSAPKYTPHSIKPHLTNNTKSYWLNKLLMITSVHTTSSTQQLICQVHRKSFCFTSNTIPHASLPFTHKPKRPPLQYETPKPLSLSPHITKVNFLSYSIYWQPLTAAIKSQYPLVQLTDSTSLFPLK